MARYMVHVPRDVLSEGHKAEIAKSIVAAHHEITGDESDAVQVAITEIDAGCFFAGGRLIECDHIFVHGYTPNAASLGDRKDRLISRLFADVTKAADFDLDSAWVTISEL
jgi:phenylpyruvate tautomerase PptA (4-oxalocrotonate tautomerase family)